MVRVPVEVLAAIICPRCGATSYHPRDVAEGYCGRCSDWTRVELPAGMDAAAALAHVEALLGPEEITVDAVGGGLELGCSEHPAWAPVATSLGLLPLLQLWLEHREAMHR